MKRNGSQNIQNQFSVPLMSVAFVVFYYVTSGRFYLLPDGLHLLPFSFTFQQGQIYKNWWTIWFLGTVSSLCFLSRENSQYKIPLWDLEVLTFSWLAEQFSFTIVSKYQLRKNQIILKKNEKAQCTGSLVQICTLVQNFQKCVIETCNFSANKAQLIHNCSYLFCLTQYSSRIHCTCKKDSKLTKLCSFQLFLPLSSNSF